MATFTLVTRQHHGSNRILSGFRNLNSLLPGTLDNEPVRNLKENASPVTGSIVASAGPAMLKTLQNLNTLSHDVVRGLAVEATHKSDTAGVPLKRSVVQGSSA
jgi:hypothetical protein